MASIEVLHVNATRPETEGAKYNGFHPGSTLLAKGHKREPDRAAFIVDTIFDRDMEVPMRDGLNMRADIFRPASSDADDGEKVPVIVAWSSYGKTGTGFFQLDMTPGRAGVPRSRTSGYEKFEAPDPAEWTARGYAICNIDARGSWDSQGNIRWCGSDEGKDAYDAIEHLASLPWCNGSVTMAGNSWLGISQWFTAAERPPHLKCIAPLEGASDFYRDIIAPGGVPNIPMQAKVQEGICGRQKIEDLVGMIYKYPTWNEYWEKKRAKLENIEIPAYVLASYSTGLHTEGSFRGFENIRGPKWLRVHPTQEWYDLYTKECNEELQLFFDRYTKNIMNDWEKTPKVRVSILRFNDEPIVNHVFPAWPIPNTQFKTLYLGAGGTLDEKPTTDGGAVTYKSDVPCLQMGNDDEECAFSCTFDADTYLVGYAKAVLWMAAEDADDMDIFVQLRKADRDGNLLDQINIPPSALDMAAQDVPSVNVLKYRGPPGILRASHRELDDKLSGTNHPVPSHRILQMLKPGKPVRLEVGIWPGGMAFSPGEKLVVKICGHDMRYAEFPGMSGTAKTLNVGRHTIYCGKSGHVSEVTVPLSVGRGGAVA
ncbi:hypothetical protein SBRCBS47491_010158 [Sporothrix bragantina]|uniref:Xaa-Pro dipeptidyl-peptidase C-terminal domain-containing protein n=1 Tax=Sporothrix bragantina TaxID=671064 RepID=A0ABP0D198_9PEZI